MRANVLYHKENPEAHAEIVSNFVAIVPKPEPGAIDRTSISSTDCSIVMLNAT